VYRKIFELKRDEVPRSSRKSCNIQLCDFYSPTYISASPSSRAILGVGLRSSPAEIVGSNPTGCMDVCFECRVLSGRGLCDELISHSEESY